MDMTSIGKNIRRFRTDKNMRQEVLAEKTDLSTNYISMIERGEKIPSLSSLIKISNALGVTSDMLLCELITESYCVKSSVLIDRISGLSQKEQQKIYAVIETMLKYADS